MSTAVQTSIKLPMIRIVAESVLCMLQGLSARELQLMISSFEEYHDFEKVELPDHFLSDVLDGYFNLTVDEVEIDVVRVTRDLRHRVHRHNAPACCIIMGQQTHVDNPRNALAYLRDSWFPIGEGQILEIPSLVDHGFTVGARGVLYFLSVQSPRRQSGDGRDDWQQDQ